MKIRNLLLVGVAVAAVLLVTSLVRGGPRLSEEDHIREVVDRARQGVVKHEVSEIFTHISRNYDDGNYNYDQLRGLIIYGLRQYRDVTVTLYVKEIKVEGEHATANVEVQAAGATEYGDKAHFEGVLEVHLAREPARRYLMLPDHRWRVVKIENFSDVQDSFAR